MFYIDNVKTTGGSGGAYGFYCADNNAVNVFNGQTIINEAGAAGGDFRVESDSNANVIFVDAGENRLGLFGTETTAATNYANGVCTKTGIGCYSVSVSNISAGATSANIDIPFSRIGDGIAEFAFHAHGNGGTTNFGIVAHFYVQGRS